MFEKMGIFFSLFRKGNEIADVEKWKGKQISANSLAALFVVMLELAKAYGYDIPISEVDLLKLAGGVIVIVNTVLTCITSKRAGLPAKEPAQPEPARPVPAPVYPAPEQPAAAPVPAPAPAQPMEEPPLQPVDQTDPRKGTYFG
jgi:hypothetical protein